MAEPLSRDQAFIKKLTDIVLANLANENFDVKELIHDSGMSYSALSKRLKSINNKNINQFIREVRLQKALEMLQEGKVTASEVAYKVGFSSPTYFNTCFHEFFGFPPGQVKKGRIENLDEIIPAQISSVHEQKKPGKRKIFLILSGVFLFMLISYLVYAAFLKNNTADDRTPAKNPEKSIIVLPFRNLSDDPEYQWFAYGITEDILNHLFRIGDLRVISRTTSEYYFRNTMTSPEIARKLNVNYFLEGSVSRDGDRVRIYVQLIDARNDKHLLSEKFENDMTNIFEIQSDIAKKVADKLEAAITDKEIGQIEKIPTKNSEAYKLYLHGRFFLNKRTSDGFTKSIGYFEKAIAADTGYALAWAGLADAYFLMNWWEELPVQDRDDYMKAKEYVLRALELDRNLAEAHAVLGALLAWYDWNWEEARKELKLATELNPNYTFGHSYYFELLNILGEDKEAREQLNIALDLDPFVPVFHLMSGWDYHNKGKYYESINEFQKVIELDPSSNQYMGFFNCYAMLDDSTNALNALDKALGMNKIPLENPDFLNDIYRESGINGIWNWMIEKELDKSRPSSWNLTFLYLRTGKKDKALDMLESLLEEKIILLPTINNTFFLDIIRSEPRFQALIKKMGLSDYQKRLGK